jgi:hypothetical protein
MTTGHGRFVLPGPDTIRPDVGTERKMTTLADERAPRPHITNLTLNVHGSVISKAQLLREVNSGLHRTQRLSGQIVTGK